MRWAMSSGLRTWRPAAFWGRVTGTPCARYQGVHHPSVPALGLDAYA